MSPVLRIVLAILFLIAMAIFCPFMIGNKWGTHEYGETAFATFVIGGVIIFNLSLFLSLLFDIDVLND